MANKELILKSNLSVNDKAILTLLCTAQDISSKINKALAKFDLSQEQLQVLHSLDEAPEGTLTVNQIRSSFVTDSPNISRMLNKLVEKGFIIKERDSKDQRIVYVHITEKGRELHEEADEIVMENMPKLSEMDSEELINIVMKL